ncbi:hypothetical protein AVEN_77831-1 [Araneus ventricosus]|uniref:Reverse transcriptase RNase H-like domain-containing protein n=1 Tax=Araneus ventricosus TaxID=182803 RepID=A0A4Y2GQ42_ARAVE|nr:hypothetical protein AVEN_77831-1 [Araneus ventricosus]
MNSRRFPSPRKPLWKIRFTTQTPSLTLARPKIRLARIEPTKPAGAGVVVRVGIVMSQRDSKNEEHPILYLSKKFSDSERKYSTTERECACIIYAIKKLKYYLDGQKFTIQTDHNPLVWLKINAGTNPRLKRWSLCLQPFNYKVVHRAGKKNQNADCLSRSEL